MRHIKYIKKSQFWILNLVMAFVVPFLVNVFHLSSFWNVVLVLFVLNVGYSIFISYLLKRRGAAWFWLLIWPGLFTIAVFFNMVPQIYGYMFAAVYLVVEALVYYTGQIDDHDVEKQIPVDGGYRSV